jgi:L,D-transpeptidase catalytic domain
MVILSSGTGTKESRPDTSGRYATGQGTTGQGTIGDTIPGHATPSHATPSHATLGRMAAVASVGLCFLSGAAQPAAASSHHHHPESAAGKPEAPKPPAGPLILAISIAGQRVTVYDNGTPIASSQVSTGVPGHPTPTGIFSIIQKQRFHHSNLYSNAPMPFMQRITWSGVALHAGVVPGHPASHGCIRLPDRFATQLWGLTKVGARVIISRGELTPYEIDHPRLAALVKPAEPPKAEAAAPNVVVATTGAVTPDEHPRDSRDDADGHGAAPVAANSDNPVETRPAAEPQAPKAEPSPTSKIEEAMRRPGQLSLFVSRREGKLFVRKGFTPVFDTPVTIAHPEMPLGTHVFTASRPAHDNTGMRWLAVSLGFDRAAASGSSAHGKHKGRGERTERPAPMTADALRQAAAAALDRIELPPEALDRIGSLVVPGTSLVISDQGLGGETGQDTDFIVVTKQ